MRFTCLKAGIAGLVVATSSFANATLMKTTMDFTIISVRGDYANVRANDIFTFEAIYNDEGDFAQTHESGTGRCLETYTPTPGGARCTTIYLKSHTPFITDASTNWMTLFDTASLAIDGNYFYDVYTSEKELVYSNSAGELRFDIHNDYMISHVNQGKPYEDRYATMRYRDKNHSYKSSQVKYRASNMVTSPVSKVPEPSTLAIFALGMIGLASRRFKKQS